MEIRKANMAEYDEILRIYERARQFMRETGNPNQWKNSEPTPGQVMTDIESGELYVIYDDIIEGVFVLTEGSDPTYDYIEGKWLDGGEYRAVHRVASAGRKKGMLKLIMDYAFSHISSVKIDTHKDNKVMQHQLEKYGFVPCGTILLQNGESRIAYQMVI